MDDVYKKFKKSRLDAISPTFCAAKWNVLSLWIETGTTSSCCIAGQSKIDLNKLTTNKLEIHNTDEKIKEKRDLLNGIRSPSCDECWYIERSGNLSQRITMSYDFRDNDFETYDLNPYQIPQHITLALDSLCNFNCSYCSPTISSSWRSDLIKNGPFKTKYDVKRQYQRLGDNDKLSIIQQEKLYKETKSMILTHINSLRSLSLIGGEPTISPRFWDLFNSLMTKDCSNLDLIITTNMSNHKKLKEILEQRNKFKSISVHVSLDSIGQTAEFIRKGLVWNDTVKNVQNILETSDSEIKFLLTISALSLDNMTKLLNWIHDLYDQYPGRISYYATIVRTPEFQCIEVLPMYLKNIYYDEIERFTDKFRSIDGTDSLHRVLVHLRNSVNDELELQHDLKVFVREYARRHSLNIEKSFSTDIAKFILSESER